MNASLGKHDAGIANVVRKAVLISKYFIAHDIPVRGNRAVATWRGGKNWNVSIDDGKGLWYDHKASVGGSVIDACMVVEGLSVQDAIRTLAGRYGLKTEAPCVLRFHNAPQKRKTEPIKPRIFPHYFRKRMDNGKTTGICSSGTLRGASPVNVHDMDPWAARTGQLAAMYRPDEIVHICVDPRDHNGHPTIPMMGHNIMSVEEWCDPAHKDRLINAGELVKANPYTGNEDKGHSLISSNCVARFRNMLLECDALPLADQCSLWAGTILGGWPIVALVYSGGKSIHAVWRVDAADRAGFDRRKDDALRLLCADPDPRYRIDKQTLSPVHGVRLAGCRRPKTGRQQALLFLNPDLMKVSARPPAPPVPSGGDLHEEKNERARPSSPNIFFAPAFAPTSGCKGM